MEELLRAKDTRKFYEKLNRSRKDFVPQAHLCRDCDGNLLTNERVVVKRWRQHYDEHLNGDVTSSQGSSEVTLGARVEDERLPHPDLQEVETENGRSKNNKAAGAAEILW